LNKLWFSVVDIGDEICVSFGACQLHL